MTMAISPRREQGVFVVTLAANIMHVLAVALPIAGPFTALWLDRPVVYGGLAGNRENFLALFTGLLAGLA
jgi:hypothetical protein